MYKLGKFLGEGAYKRCFTYGRHQVLLVSRPGSRGHQNFLWEEHETLTSLAAMGFPVPSTIVVATQCGKPALLQERLYDVWDYAKTIDGLSTISRLMSLNDIYIEDLQWMTDRSGHILINDPMGIVKCQDTWDDVDRTLDEMIDSALRYNRLRRKIKSHRDFRSWYWSL